MAADSRRLRLAPRALLRALSIAALVASAASCDSPSTNGPLPVADYPVGLSYHDPATGDLRVFLYHWPLGSVVRVYADPAAQPAGWDLAAAVVDGGRRWEPEMYYREASLRLVSSPADADVIVHFDAAPPLLDIPAGCDVPFIQAAAVTLLCANERFDGLATLPLANGGAGHVKMDVTVVATRVADAAQLRRVVAHEIGHVLGIGGHSGNPADLMYPAPEVDSPSEADGRSLRYALHAPDAVVP
ncbi:MAG TPA: matrixin family metalloprotease [Gemmatimonadaceae bacterium]|nr:matrixin family metalloprotease [Gemmatimonadaceae bacterium]